MHRASIVIVTPAATDANNGNWQTARRWAQMLSAQYRVRIADRWEGGDEALLIALHARKSAPAVQAWRAAGPARPVLLVMTGTDLYRDIDTDASARAALDSADAIVVLNSRGGERLPTALQARCRVVLQSCAARVAVPKPTRHLRALMVGHLRDEKDPRCFFRAVARLAPRGDLRFDHVGAALDSALGTEAQALQSSHPHYRWLGARPHPEVRRRIQHAHVLVHPSRMEGGAHVVIEAVRSGTPVLASAIDGNLGLLGDDYAGCFAPGDDAGLAALLERARDDPAMLPTLTRQIAARAPLFAPRREADTLRGIVAGLIDGAAGDPR